MSQENHKIPIKKENLTGTAKSCVEPSAVPQNILETVPVCSLSGWLYLGSERETVLCPPCGHSRVDLTMAPLDVPGGCAGRSGGEISRAGLAAWKGKSFPLARLPAHPSAVWLVRCLLWSLRLLECPRSAVNAHLDSAASVPGRAPCPVPGSFGKGLRLPKCRWKVSGSVCVHMANIWSELGPLRWFSKHAARGEDFDWILDPGNHV